MDTIDNFFITENHVGFVSEDEYVKAAHIVEAIEAIARISYQSFYIIDYYKKNFLFVSDNPFFLCGLTPEEVKKLGYAFYSKHVPKDDLDMLLKINHAGFHLFNKASIEDRLNLSISYDYHITNKHGTFLINQKLAPIRLADNGNIWLAVCVVSLSTNKKAGNITAHLKGSNDCWTYSLKNQTWKKEKIKELTEREKDIMQFTSQGFSAKEMAGRLHIGHEAVKYHKRLLFAKLNVQNIHEAIAVASNAKLI